jgi:signal transduction histidine kinase
MLFLTLGTDMTRPSRTGGKTSEAKGRNARPATGRKTTKTKRRIAPATRVKRRSISGSSKDLKEARKQQAATAAILKVIAGSPSDVQPVFDAIATSANNLIGCFSTAVFRFVDGASHLAAFTPTHTVADDILKASFPRPLAGYQPFESTKKGEPLQIADTEVTDARIQDIARARGFRSMLLVPLMSHGVPIGMISATRTKPGTFADHHVQLLQTFADQAVIAIENARLFNDVQARTRDLTESLQQQTATADVLKVISRSAFDLQTVLDTLTETAAKLCNADMASISRQDGPAFYHVTNYNFAPDWVDYTKSFRMQSGRGSVVGRVLLEGRPLQVADVLADPEYTYLEPQKKSGYRTFLGVPLLREGLPIGVLSLCRRTVEPFTEKQLELLSTFADQAVIAIENVRLFDEVQARTHELTESLAQQTATADVLKVISRSTFDLKVVLLTLVESAARLCDADKATITREKDGRFFRAETFGFSDEFMDYVRDIPVLPERGSCIGRTLLEGVVVHIPDVQSDPDYTFVEGQRLGNFRTMLGVPMLREGVPVGVVALTRSDVRPFTNKQIELVTTFADQAAIAIENVRLFESAEARTRELAQSLDDLRTAQDRLVQTEKLASLGQLTAGIAHEIKNPLNFVNNFSALSAELTDELKDLLKSAAIGEKMREEVDELTGLLKDNLEKVIQHGKRADSIVKNMLLHSREGSGEHRAADINTLLDESLNLAYHGARAEKGEFKITLQRDFDKDAGTIELFPQEITRALLNLISNGVYAATKRKMEDQDAGFEPTLRATTRNLGSTVEIRIRDNGTGIPAEVQEKMFNPFFTTKPAGEGTGLGLSMTHDIIVKQHGGRIDVDTEPGQFTEFTIVLPRRSNVLGGNRGQQ